MIIEVLGYSALACAVIGSILVFLKDSISIFAMALWIYSNPVFIYFILKGYTLMSELMFVSYSVMTYTALLGFVLKYRGIREYRKHWRNVEKELGLPEGTLVK